VALLSRLSRLQQITLYLVIAFIANIGIARLLDAQGFAIFSVLIFFLLIVSFWFPAQSSARSFAG